MKAFCKKYSAPLALIVLVWLLAGCHDNADMHPFFAFEIDSDSDTFDDTDTSTGTSEDPDSDTDPCPPDFVDDYGRCIRFVNMASVTSECGTSWDDAFDRIQDGIESAYISAQILGYCEVWVAEGFYISFEGDPTDSIRMRKDVHVFGGFGAFETELDERDVEENRTILTGRDMLGLESSYHVVMGAMDSTLDGFTISGGDAVGDAPHHRGGGMYINSANTRVSNCTFSGNRATDGGAVFSYDGAAEITNSSFTGNHAERGGAMYVLNGMPAMEDLTIFNNLATENGGGIYTESLFGACNPALVKSEVYDNIAWEDGGGIFNKNCNLSVYGSEVMNNIAGVDGGGLGAFRGETEVVNSTIEGNRADGSGGGVLSNDNETVFTSTVVADNAADESGGGVFLSWSEGTFDSCLISGNRAGEKGGGFYLEMDTPVIVNTLINGNQAEEGGGVYSGQRGDPEIVNCVLNQNRAQQKGGALYNAELSEVHVANSILWGDLPNEVFDEPGSGTTVSFCDVDGGYAGVHIINEDPMFISPGYWDDLGTTILLDDVWSEGDYHLQSDSPCIDNANDTVSPVSDADGNAWEDMTDVGLPSAAADQGAYDCKI